MSPKAIVLVNVENGVPMRVKFADMSLNTFSTIVGDLHAGIDSNSQVVECAIGVAESTAGDETTWDDDSTGSSRDG